MADERKSLSEILKPALEPGAVEFAAAYPHNPLGEALAISTAISLKRIADAMTETNEYGETGSQAVGGHVKRAAQEIVSIIHHSATSRR